MIAYIVSLSLLILTVILIRAVFRNSVSSRLIYALWAVVIIRMVLPVTLFHVNVRLSETISAPQTGYAEHDSASVAIPDNHSATDISSWHDVSETLSPVKPVEQGTETGDQPAVEIRPDSEPVAESAGMDWKQILNVAWAAGASILALWFIITGISFNAKLVKNRSPLGEYKGKKVYVSECSGVPCIAGIVPSIYITPSTSNKEAGPFVIRHEYMHIKHGDHLWSIIRVAALIVFWWNPLVWAAAILSKRDSEFACDEAASAHMNNKGRLRYARVILDTTPQNRPFATGLGSAPLKERILRLTSGRRNKVVCLALVIILGLCVVGCSFGSISNSTDTGKGQTASDTMPPSETTDTYDTADSTDTSDQTNATDSDTGSSDTTIQEPDTYEPVSGIDSTSPESEELSPDTDEPVSDTNGSTVSPEPQEQWGVSYRQEGNSINVAFTVGSDSDSWSGFLSSDKTDVTMDTIWSMETATPAEVRIAFYPGMFPEQSTLRKLVFETLSSLQVPSLTETSDIYNTPDVRESVSRVFIVILNDMAVSGDLYRTQGNGHVDFVFRFSEIFDVRPGDVITIIAATDNDSELSGSPEKQLDELRNRFSFHEQETIENSLCYAIFGYFSGTTNGNTNDICIVYKDGGIKSLNSSVLPYFQTIDHVEFSSPSVINVSGKVLAEEGAEPVTITAGIDIYSGSMRFLTLEDLLAVHGKDYSLGYSKNDFLEGVDKFVHPDRYRNKLSDELYTALSGLGITDYFFTYDNRQVYITFTLAGTPIGTLKKGVNTCVISQDIYEGVGVVCAPDWYAMNYSSSVRTSVSEYIRWSYTRGMYRKTVQEWPEFTNLIVRRLKEKGVEPTKTAVIEYAERCFGLIGYEPQENQFDENGNHIQLGYDGGKCLNWVIVDDYESGGIVTVVVRFFKDDFFQLYDETYEYTLTTDDGDWKFVDAVEIP